MLNNLQKFISEMTVVEMVEYGSVVILLVLALIIFVRSSGPFSKFFLPICCIMAAAIQLVTWAQYGDEPAFMTPLVRVVSAWIS